MTHNSASPEKRGKFPALCCWPARRCPRQRSADRRERALWAREDELRTFEHRRTAYVDFYQANVDAQRSAAAYFSARPRGDDTVEWPPLPPLLAALALAEQRREVLKMYATPRVTTLARKAQEAYRTLVSEARRQVGTGRRPRRPVQETYGRMGRGSKWAVEGDTRRLGRAQRL